MTFNVLAVLGSENGPTLGPANSRLYVVVMPNAEPQCYDIKCTVLRTISNSKVCMSWQGYVVNCLYVEVMYFSCATRLVDTPAGVAVKWVKWRTIPRPGYESYGGEHALAYAFPRSSVVALPTQNRGADDLQTPHRVPAGLRGSGKHAPAINADFLHPALPGLRRRRATALVDQSK